MVRPRLVALVLGALCAAVAAGSGLAAATERTAGLIVFASDRAPDLTNGEVFVVSADGRGSRSLTRTPFGDESDAGWSPDGRLVAFQQRVSRGFALAVMPARGGAVRRLATARGSISFSWSPRGDRIVFAAGGDLWAVASRGGRAVRLTRDPAADDNPAWSPDGRTIAFERGGAVFVMPAGGGPARRLATGGMPLWAPDGRTLALSADGKLTVVGRNGGGLRSLATGEDPAWSPDGRSLAFAQDGGVFVVGATGGEPRRVASGEAPAWSPDGRRLAFLSTDGISVVAARGGAEEPVAGVPRFSDPLGRPCWSPDGKSLLLAARLDENDDELYTVRADGTDVRALTSDAVDESSPSWSPDGKRIAFERGGSSLDEAPTGSLVVMGADGRSPHVLVDAAGDPAWSPDGKRLAFVSGRDFAQTDDPAATNEIYVVGADGGAPERLTTNDVRDVEPAWSPDGRRIAFVRGATIDAQAVWTMNADGTGQQKLVAGSQPAWTPDGKRLAFVLPGGGTVATIAADGSGSPRRLVAGYRPAWSPDGASLVFTRVVAADGQLPNGELFVARADGTHVRRLTRNPAFDDEASWGRG